LSPGLISLNPDLKQLRDEGYEVSTEKDNGYLLVSHVPYVNSRKQVAFGTLISDLNLSGDKTNRPNDHVAKWAGEYPCDSNGSQLQTLVCQPINEKIRDGLIATFSFSQKPPEGYPDYYQKMTAYIRILEGYAHAIDPSVTSRTFVPVGEDDKDSIFCYLDTATSRAGISAMNDKLKKGKIAIIGLGGTGAYVLDLLAKTPIEEIHLFDGDDFLQHNAFRSPGAPSIEDLTKKQKKVERFSEIYSRMRKNIFPHAQFIDEKNVDELKQMEFVFLCMEGESKKNIVDYLIGNNISFIDVGIGLCSEDNSLGGMARVTTCTPAFHNHSATRITFGEDEVNEYSQNIQIADINALNAALAVIKWKKLRGFYTDLGHEHNTTYGIDTNTITNDEMDNENKADQT